jgi:hypothetical protein
MNRRRLSRDWKHPPALQCLVLMGLLGCLAGCALPREITKTPRSAIEQLLLGQALHRSLLNVSIPLPLHEPIFMEVSSLQSGFVAPYLDHNLDQIFIKDTVASRMGSLGHRVVKAEQDATYVVRVVVEAFGTIQSSSFFGLPSIQSVIIPFSLPQLTVYQNLSQDGYVRYSLNVIERTSGTLIFSTPWYHQSTFHDQYTILFFITFRRTDLADAP